MPGGLPNFSGAGGESTAAQVHATLCALVTTEAAKHSAWADYAAVLLDEETAAFFASRLRLETTETDAESNPTSKEKRELDTERTANDAVTDDAIEVSLRVACFDGTTLDVTLPERGLVREVKRIVGQVRPE
jgi:hypothetical protein